MDAVCQVYSPSGSGSATGGRPQPHQAAPATPTTWTVVELIDGQSFTWTATGPGMRASAHHRIEQTPTGSRAILSIDQEGILGRSSRALAPT